MSGTANGTATDPAAGTARGPALWSDRRWMWMVAAFGATGAAQLVSQLVAGRLLGSAEFGEAATLINLINLVGIPLVAVQLTTTAAVARGSSAAPTLRRYLAWGTAAGVAAAVTAPLWAGALAVEDVGACRVAALFLPAAFLVAVTRGNVIGQARTGVLAASMSGAAVVRVLGSAAGAWWFGAPGAVAGAVLSELALGGLLLASCPRAGVDAGPIRSREAAAATTAQVAMWLVVNVDLLWARRLLPEDQAGSYLVAGGVSLGVVAFGQAYLWHAASRATSDRAGVAIVVRSLAVVVGGCLTVTAVAVAVLPQVMGPSFQGLRTLLLIGGLWSLPASVVLTSTATQIVAGRGLRRLVPAAVVAVAVPPLAVAVVGADAEVLAVAALLNATFGVLVVFVPQLVRSRARQHRSADGAPAVDGVPAAPAGSAG